MCQFEYLEGLVLSGNCQLCSIGHNFKDLRNGLAYCLLNMYFTDYQHTQRVFGCSLESYFGNSNTFPLSLFLMETRFLGTTLHLLEGPHSIALSQLPAAMEEFLKGKVQDQKRCLCPRANKCNFPFSSFINGENFSSHNKVKDAMENVPLLDLIEVRKGYSNKHFPSNAICGIITA